MRLFLGIALHDETKHALASFADGLRQKFPRLRWSSPEQWHITLHFLGEIREAQHDCIVERLGTVCAEPVEINVEAPGFFERAGIFHVAVKVTESLAHLHRDAGKALSECGFRPEARPYSPHITLARNKGRAISPDFKLLRKTVEKTPAPSLPRFTAREFRLYQSFTGPSGSRYEVRERFPLR